MGWPLVAAPAAVVAAADNLPTAQQAVHSWVVQLVVHTLPMAHTLPVAVAVAVAVAALPVAVDKPGRASSAGGCRGWRAAE